MISYSLVKFGQTSQTGFQVAKQGSIRQYDTCITSEVVYKVRGIGPQC